MIITIDGPAGSGKSTAARELAKRLGVAYLDTGAMYRAVTLRAIKKGIDLSDPSAAAQCAREADLKLTSADGIQHVHLDGWEVTRELRSVKVTDNARHIASVPEARRVLVDAQRRIGVELGSFVTEGRDQGSVAFPDADVKFYLEARPEVRARRRYKEMFAAGQPVTFKQVFESIQSRDASDESREVGPLTRPEGAVVVDTSDMNVEQMVEDLARRVEAAR